MNTRLSALVVAAVFGLSACGNATDSPSVSNDPTADPMPTVAPVPAGAVMGQGLVIDSPDGPILCMGAVAESYPPQCGVGPGTVKLANWKWKPVMEYVDSGSDLRFGTFVVTGTLDGDVLTVTDPAIPLALYDPMVIPDDRPCVEPSDDPEDIQAALADLPGYWGSFVGSDDKPCVQVDVLFDDGTLQAWVDDTYGAGAVLINSSLDEVSS